MRSDLGCKLAAPLREPCLTSSVAMETVQTTKKNRTEGTKARVHFVFSMREKQVRFELFLPSELEMKGVFAYFIPRYTMNLG